MTDTTTLLNKADVLRGRSLFTEALRLSKRALKQAVEDEERLRALFSLGDTCRMTGDFTNAVEYYGQTIALAKHLKKPLDALDASVGLGLAHRALGEWKASIKHLESALKRYRKRKDEEGTAFTLWALAGALRIKGDIPDAVEMFTEAKKAFQKLGDESGIGYSLCGMGGSSRVMGRFPGSLKYYTQANKVFREIRDRFGIAYSHCGIGNALRMQGDMEGAKEHFFKATTIYKRIGDIVSYSYTLWSLGKVYMTLERYGLAEKYTNDALKNFRKTKDPRGVIYCLLSQAEIDHLRGSLAPAKKKAAKALAEAAKYGFQVEHCHASALQSRLEGDRTDNSCYKTLGLRLRFSDIPFDIP